MNPIDSQKTLSEILLAEPGYAGIFQRIGFDFARDGSRPFTEICRAEGLDIETTLRLLPALFSAPASPPAAMEIMSLSQICDQLETLHHPALLEELARAEGLVFSLPKQSDNIHDPKIVAIRKHFATFRKNLTHHLREEAEALFPLIRQLESDGIAETGVMDLLKDPLARMKDEHNEADEDLAALEVLTSEDTGGSCDPEILEKLRALFRNLEATLQGQIYQENQVLFRRALAMLSP